MVNNERRIFSRGVDEEEEDIQFSPPKICRQSPPNSHAFVDFEEGFFATEWRTGLIMWAATGAVGGEKCWLTMSAVCKQIQEKEEERNARSVFPFPICAADDEGSNIVRSRNFHGCYCFTTRKTASCGCRRYCIPAGMRMRCFCLHRALQLLMLYRGVVRARSFFPSSSIPFQILMVSIALCLSTTSINSAKTTNKLKTQMFLNDGRIHFSCCGQ